MGVAMGSSLSPVFAGVIIVQLETSWYQDHIIIYLSGKDIDGTFTFFKEESMTFVLDQQNSYQPTLQFTCKLETEAPIPFLDVFVIKKNSKFKTINRKRTTADIYLHWFSHAPNIFCNKERLNCF